MSSDITETVESERYQEILTLKKRVLETRDEIDRAAVTGQVRRGQAIELYQRKVRDYVMAVETILNPADGDPSEYWAEEPIADFTVPNGEHKTVTGLSEFLELPLTFDVEVERERQRSYRHAAETATQIEQVRPPERLIEEAFRATNRALDAAGFDLEEPTERQQSGFERADDVDKATRILDFLRQLDDDGLREVQLLIERDLLAEDDDGQDGNLTNGTYE